MTSAATAYKSPLQQMTQTTPTCLWNDSASIAELTDSISHGAVGATCNPVIGLTALKDEMGTWKPRIAQLIREMPSATEDQIGWKLIEELSVRAAELLRPAFEKHRGRNGRLSIQTDPRNFRSSEAILEQTVRFSKLAPNMIVKIPATPAGIPATEEATQRGVPINSTGMAALPRIDEPVDPGIVGELQERFPDFRRAYTEGGLGVDEFDGYGATRRTLRQFIGAVADLDALVRDFVVPNPDK